jgi:RNA recognition motif-containing protein
MHRIFVGNIPFSTSATDLERWFNGKGFSVETVEIIQDRATRRPRGFGFVQLSDPVGEAAVNTLNGQMFNGRPITVGIAQPARNSHRDDPDRPVARIA